MSEVISFPSKGDDLLVGPFEYWTVVVQGRAIPRLTGRRTEDGAVNFIVDGRFMGGPFRGEMIEQAAYLIAQALAVGEGYSSLDAEQKGHPFAPILHQLGAAP